jgi:glycosyltransferase involved in cell wall biosynthesis
MQLAVVAPSPVPFTIGGAENLVAGLCNYINEHTQHRCELIKLPSRESNLWQIIDTYEAFSKIDLSHFDCVISTKYPSWMISHANHICYMLHRLRGLYDTYHFMQEPVEFAWEGPMFADLRQWMPHALEHPEAAEHNLRIFFEKIRHLKEIYPDSNEFRFPGPFSRQVVHFLDTLALSPDRIRRYAAISNNVKNRAGYFPPGVSVMTLYPPSRLSGFRCGSDDYIFTVSRLDAPKRISLLIEAMRCVKADIPLLIAGTGPEDDKLKELAQGDPRIKFLGFLNDKELLECYANALAVAFVPYDEDFGYICTEAMASGKPVLTTLDSGGPNEFVTNGETGFSVPADPEALAERIDYLCSHRNEAHSMGQKAQERTAGIDWKTVVQGLIEMPAESKPKQGHVTVKTKSARRKLVVTTTFPIYPPRGGGQSRVFHLYRNLARFVDVEVVSFCEHGQPPFDQEIAQGMREIRIPRSHDHQQAEIKLSESVGWVPVTDIVMPQLYQKTPAYVEALRTATAEAAVGIVSHPYLVDAFTQVAPHLRVWFEAQDVEYDLKRQILSDNDPARALLEIVEATEGKCWRIADVVFACTDEDLQRMERLYGSTQTRKLVVPNGVSLKDVHYVDEYARSSIRARLGMADRKLVLFMGSWHGPNLEAVKRVLMLAEAFSNVVFLVVGSAGLAFKDRKLPENVLMLGVVDDLEKDVLLNVAHVALNPMTAGSGSNLKMLDYFSSGTPVISTPFGARGIEAENGVHFLSADVDAFALELVNFLANPEAFIGMAENARRLVERSYSWDVLADKLYAEIRDLLN